MRGLIFIMRIVIANLLLFASVLFGAERQFAGEVRFEQRIGGRLPLAVLFTDAKGARHALGDYFHGKPVVVYFGYARCAQLCPLVSDGTVAALRDIRPEAGRDYEVVSLSIDPSETKDENHDRQLGAVRRYGRPDEGDGWNFLTGDETAIRAVTDAAGFYYVSDPHSRQYAHASGFLVITPDGRISRYFIGLDFRADEVAAALKRAGHGETGPSAIDLLLLCFRGEGVTGRYGVMIWRSLEVAVSLTVLTLAGGIGWMLLRERRFQNTGGGDAS